MAYKDFTLSDLREQFQVDNKIVKLFDATKVVPIQPSDLLLQLLEEAESLSLKSEKARSEFIVTPVLFELRRITQRFFTIYSGDSLIVDKEKGLTGECDFILTKDTGTFDINYPIIQIVEAKKHDMELGVNQCAAQVYGAYLFNQKSGVELEKVYGCVTTGELWKFIVLEENIIKVDNVNYHKSQLDKILGIFQQIMDYYKSVID